MSDDVDLTDDQREAFERLADSDLPVAKWAEKLLALADAEGGN